MNIQSIIKDKNIRLTDARKVLLDIFLGSSKPLSYDDIKSKLSMDKATFYRNISKFENENIINSFESNDKKRYFEIVKNPHAHFICNNCNKIECINEEIKVLLVGYNVENIIITGSCTNCI